VSTDSPNVTAIPIRYSSSFVLGEPLTNMMRRYAEELRHRMVAEDRKRDVFDCGCSVLPQLSDRCRITRQGLCTITV
jgi:hypothetical protein